MWTEDFLRPEHKGSSTKRHLKCPECPDWVCPKGVVDPACFGVSVMVLGPWSMAIRALLAGHPIKSVSLPTLPLKCC